MKVIIVSPSLDPQRNVSGVSAVTQFILRHCKGVDFRHFTLGRADGERGGWRRLPALLRRLTAWRTLLRTERDAVVHYNFPLSRASILRDPVFIAVARCMRHPIVLHIHGGHYLCRQSIPWPLRWLMQWAFRGQPPVIVLSEQEREVLARYGVQHIHVLPNAVAEDVAPRLPHAPTGEALTLGYLGRITADKGMAELLAACRTLQGQGIPFRLLMAGREEGDSAFVPAFAEALGAQFCYAGVVSGREKTAFLQSIDVFVLPSYFEGLPMSLMESMSVGAVPVVTPVGSVPTVVADGSNGLLVAAHESDGVAAAIARLHADRSLWHRLSDAAQATIAQQFSPDQYVTRLTSIYDQVSSTR